MEERYFSISNPKTGAIIAMSDGQALGRVIAEYLLQYLVGAPVGVTVVEVSQEKFRAYKSRPGTVRV